MINGIFFETVSITFEWKEGFSKMETDRVAMIVLLELKLRWLSSIKTFGAFLGLFFVSSLFEDTEGLLLPEKLPLHTPHVPPLLQWAHPEQLEQAEQVEEPVHLLAL
ncbi:hypothetical protein CRH01_16420 [Chryseobacterium rhizosphaerae]|nr:hypothetical protein CRH01_16420 [Chryseobacterium rhizosphaerae]